MMDDCGWTLRHTALQVFRWPTLAHARAWRPRLRAIHQALSCCESSPPLTLFETRAISPRVEQMSFALMFFGMAIFMPLHASGNVSGLSDMGRYTISNLQNDDSKLIAHGSDIHSVIMILTATDLMHSAVQSFSLIYIRSQCTQSCGGPIVGTLWFDDATWTGNLKKKKKKNKFSVNLFCRSEPRSFTLLIRNIPQRLMDKKELGRWWVAF